MAKIFLMDFRCNSNKLPFSSIHLNLFFFYILMQEIRSGNLSKYFTGRSLLARGAEEFDLLGRSSPLPSRTRPQPQGQRGPNQSPIYIYEYFRERARSLARPSGSQSLLWHPAHTSRIVGRAFVFYFFHGCARYDENGEITGVYFCESSWIILS